MSAQTLPNFDMFYNFNDEALFQNEYFFKNFDSPKNSSTYESEQDIASILDDTNSCSVPPKQTSFNELKYEELIDTINSNLTDLNLFVEDMLASEAVDPNVKRKR